MIVSLYIYWKEFSKEGLQDLSFFGWGREEGSLFSPLPQGAVGSLVCLIDCVKSAVL